MSENQWYDRLNANVVPALLVRHVYDKQKTQQFIGVPVCTTRWYEGDFRPFFQSYRTSLLTRGVGLVRLALPGRCA